MAAMLIRSNLLQQERMVTDRMSQVARAVSTVSLPRSRHILQLMKAMSGADLLLRDAWGQTLLAEDGTKLSTLEDPPGYLKPGVEPPGLPEIREIQGISFYLGEVPFGSNAQEAPLLVILMPKPPLFDELKRAAAPVGAPVFLGGGVGFLLAWVLARRISLRIRQVNDQTRRIAAGDFTPMPLDSSRDEIGELGSSVNKMAGQLDDFQERIRNDERLKLLGQVGSGLAHQMRNYVAGARLAIQLHARGCSTAKNQDLQVALRQLSLAESQINRFLDPQRLEKGARETIPLSDLVAEWTEMVAPQAAHKGIRLDFLPGPGLVLGDRNQLGDLVHNLLINAMEAAGPEGSISVEVTHRDEKVNLEVKDNGPGPSREMALKMFQPFATDKKEGIGLGLSVSRQIASSHGGELSWRRDGSWTVFRLALPEAIGRDQKERPVPSGEPIHP